MHYEQHFVNIVYYLPINFALFKLRKMLKAIAFTWLKHNVRLK